MKLWQREREAQDVGETVRTAPATDVQLPEPPQTVTLVMPSGERMPGRVTRREGEELLVLMLYPLQRPLLEVERNRIVIEITGQLEATRLGGSATLEDHETLRFTDLHVVQRREYVRVKASLPVFVTASGDASPREGMSIDLSGGGMLLRGIGQLRIGEKLDFRIEIEEEDHEIAGSGTIVRSDPDGRSAIRFEAISEGDRRRLIRFLFERQREERRKGLRPEGSNGR